MPTGLQDYINSTLAGLPSSTQGPGSVNTAQILKDRPDVLAEYNQEATRDNESKMNLQSLGIYSPDDYASWWAQRFGYTPPASTTPTPTPTTTPTTPTTPTDPNAAGSAPGSTAPPGSANYLAEARARALANAQLAVQGRGLNFDQYSGDMNSYLDNLFKGIPAGDTNPQSYIDPNFADTILNGKQNQERIKDKQLVNSKYANPNLDYHSLDDTINSILGDATKQSQDMLDAGLKRGQFNEVGVAAGQTKLAAAKEKARAKLDTTANDVFNGYNSKFSDLYNRALTSASGYQLGDTFDTSPYDAEFGRLSSSAKTDATGQLYSAMGDSPLINLADIRGAVGQGQGTTNLTDLDVLDALSKRKQASGVGRGLGSQGAF